MAYFFAFVGCMVLGTVFSLRFGQFTRVSR